MKNYYRFYECCKIVKGANRTAIYDLQRLNFYFIPNSVIEVFIDYQNKSITTLFNDYSLQKEQLMKYFNYLLTNEIIFATNNLETFPVMSSVVKKPLFLDFLFIEIDSLQKYKIDFLEKYIDRTGVVHIIIINSNNSIENLDIVLKLLDDSTVKLITFISLFHNNIIKNVIGLKVRHERLKKVIFFNSPAEYVKIKGDKDIEYFDNTLKELLTRRITSVKNFTLNIKAYIESLNYNIYFNRKAYINNNGEVKPSYIHTKCYGNIEKENLNDIIFKSDFQGLWKLTKDKINVCKDCEFRYMCPDNRVPLKNKNKYYHNTSCNYNPYTNIWKTSKKKELR